MNRLVILNAKASELEKILSSEKAMFVKRSDIAFEEFSQII